MTRRKWLIRLAGLFLLIHGVIELSALLSFLGFPPTYIFAELNVNWPLTIWVGVVAGALRILAMAGLFTNRKWGWVLALLLSVTTFTMLTFYLPFGVIDALLAGLVLAFLVTGRYGSEKILE
jgi:hypothetical protein